MSPLLFKPDRDHEITRVPIHEIDPCAEWQAPEFEDLEPDMDMEDDDGC
jgi:hypothetical protein